MATRLKASRHDKLFFRDSRLLGFEEPHCARFLSLRWSETTEAICLPVDRHTAFAMTILNLSLRAVQKARRGNLLAMTTC